jgi:hypothetical protein
VTGLAVTLLFHAANIHRNPQMARASSPALKSCPRGAKPSQSSLVLVVEKILGELLAFVIEHVQEVSVAPVGELGNHHVQPLKF